MGRARVLIFVSSLAIGTTAGGAERYGVEVARHLDQTLYEPIVCAFWRRGAPAEQFWLARLAEAGVECFFAVDRGQGFNPLRYARAVRNIRRRLGDRPVQVIHSHFQLGSVTALLLRGSTHARALVRTAHGAVRWEWRDTWLGLLCRTVFTRGVFPMCFDAETGVSQTVVDSLDRRLLARLRRKRAHLIYNAIDQAPFRRHLEQGELREQLGLGQADTVVGSVGRLSEQKGYHYLIEAAPTVLQACADCRFLIVGDGELREGLEQRVSTLGLGSVFTFAGAREDSPALYGVMDVFVLPSLFEGLPTVVIESMASAVPVVATDIAGTRELIVHEETGWLVSPKDAASLANGIVAVLRRPDRGRGLAQNALDSVVPRFHIDEATRRIQALYTSLLSTY
jgi:glycosyltransferase involved in cell wall biosynthesis